MTKSPEDDPMASQTNMLTQPSQRIICEGNGSKLFNMSSVIPFESKNRDNVALHGSNPNLMKKHNRYSLRLKVVALETRSPHLFEFKLNHPDRHYRNFSVSD